MVPASPLSPLFHYPAGCPKRPQLQLSRTSPGCGLLQSADAALCLTDLEAPLEQWLSGAGLARLESLYLRSCSGVTDTTLDQLPDLIPKLERLEISGEQRRHVEAAVEASLRECCQSYYR